MRLSASIAGLVFASTFVLAGPPNPDKLYALQSAAAAADAAAAAANAPSAHDWIDQLQPQPRSRHRRHVGRAGHAGGFGSPHEKALRRLELEQRGLAAGLERERERRLAQNASLLPVVGVEVVEPKSAVKRLSARGGGGVWTGVSSYYLFALYDSDRHAVLDAIKSGGFSAVRIFIASVGSNNKGSSSQAVSDLESRDVGSYDDTILYLIDQLMVECKDRGLKLLIACSDRYALGFWSTDSYAVKLNLVKPGSTGAQKVSDASSFYTNSWAISMFDKRLAHIMGHYNPKLGKTWAELDEVILAVEPQNEPQGHMAMASSTWACDRAAYLKSLIKSNILVSSGGGITTADSLGWWATGCSSFDIVSVHDYGTAAWSTAGSLASAQAKYPDKQIIMGEWGVTGSNKVSLVSDFVSAFQAHGLSWMYWEIVRPGKASSDFEVWTDEPAWEALTGGKAYNAPVSTSSSARSPSSTSASAWSSQKDTWSSSSAAWSPSSTAWAATTTASTSSKDWSPSSKAWSSSAPAWTPSPSSTQGWTTSTRGATWASSSQTPVYTSWTPSSTATWS
ncbi:hypothetical protein JCM8202_006094 [Rhodotorula sphaerocarpa]